MTASQPKQLQWTRQVRVLPPVAVARPAHESATPTARDRLVAALAERPRTVAQLAQQFGLSQPTVLEQVRRALAEGLVREVQVGPDERRHPAERYYAPAVPVIRQPDRELLETACVAPARAMAAALSRDWSDLLGAFGTTHLALEGWELADLWPYLQDVILRLTRAELVELVPLTAPSPHGLAWVEDLAGPDVDVAREEDVA